MANEKTLLFVGAHPDDETFGMGGTLAQYAAAGVKVYYACATRGEAGTVEPQDMNGYTSIGDMRWAELQCAAGVLGLAGIIPIGYRDSGMAGSENNKHPEALAMAPVNEVAGRIVRIIREIRADVVITHDAGGGYGHPDHIAVHYATVKAFYSAGDSSQYLDAGPAFQPQKLYFGVRPHGLMKLMVRLMPVFGRDQRHFGRNRDIDLTRMVDTDYPVNAVIRLSKHSVETRDKAAACHASQGGGRFRQGPFRMIRILDRFRGQRDCFMRADPPPTHQMEKDLFEEVSEYT